MSERVYCALTIDGVALSGRVIEFEVGGVDVSQDHLTGLELHYGSSTGERRTTGTPIRLGRAMIAPVRLMKPTDQATPELYRAHAENRIVAGVFKMFGLDPVTGETLHVFSLTMTDARIASIASSASIRRSARTGRQWSTGWSSCRGRSPISEGLAQRLQRHHQDGGGAIGVGDQPGAADGLRVHLRHHQRHVVGQAEGGGIVDDGDARGDHGRRVRLGEIARDGQQREVELAHRGIGEGLDRRLAEGRFHARAGGAGGGEEPQRGHREGPAPQDIHNFAAHRSGGADNTDTHLLRSHAPVERRRCLADTGPPTNAFRRRPGSRAARGPPITATRLLDEFATVTTTPPPDLSAVKAWPFEEARKVAARVAKSGKGSALFETGYGPSGLPHIGTFGEVARTSWVRHAFGLLSGLPSRLLAFSDDMDGLRKVPDNVPNQEMLARAYRPAGDRHSRPLRHA